MSLFVAFVAHRNEVSNERAPLMRTSSVGQFVARGNSRVPQADQRIQPRGTARAPPTIIRVSDPSRRSESANTAARDSKGPTDYFPSQRSEEIVRASDPIR